MRHFTVIFRKQLFLFLCLTQYKTFLQHLTTHTELPDLSQTIKMPAITIFTMAIRYLKDHALHLLNNPRNPEVCVRESDVYFVLTVPAIWDDKARLFMREAAVQARYFFSCNTKLQYQYCRQICNALAINTMHFLTDNSMFRCWLCLSN